MREEIMYGQIVWTIKCCINFTEIHISGCLRHRFLEVKIISGFDVVEISDVQYSR